MQRFEVKNMFTMLIIWVKILLKSVFEILNSFEKLIYRSLNDIIFLVDLNLAKKCEKIGKHSIFE
jgi:hypothetical protein